MTVRRFVLLPATVGVLIASSAWAAPAGAATLNVCGHGCRYSQIGPALAAAHSGDTVRVGPGTYHGGLTIDVSLRLVGAGPRSTVISGGRSVLTIGTFGAATEPTVSIDGVTITKGVARSSPESVPWAGREGVVALGGGVEIPANADFSGGATVTITNSVITGNRVAPVKAVPGNAACPGNRKCPFALAAGGGIDSWAKLTLRNSTVSHNRVGTASGLSNVTSPGLSAEPLAEVG